jgi:hypothetical protein
MIILVLITWKYNSVNIIFVRYCTDRSPHPLYSRTEFLTGFLTNKISLGSSAEPQGDTMKSLPARIQKSRGLFARLALITLLTALFIAAPFHAAWAQDTAPPMGTKASRGHPALLGTNAQHGEYNQCLFGFRELRFA